MKIFLNQLTAEEKRTFRKWLILLLFLSGTFIFIFPVIFTLPAPFKAWDFSQKGPVGDTINGIAAPFIAVLGIIVTFLAFYIQVKANEVQRGVNESQRADIQLERFENKFYELLRLHKENVDEISITRYNYEGTIEKRKAFVSMYLELRNAFFVVKLEYLDSKKSGTLTSVYNDIQLLKFSYIFFYTGVGVHSDKLSKAMVENDLDPLFYNKVNAVLKDIQAGHKQNNHDYLKRELELPEIGKSVLPKSYAPFVGHLNRLGHYYRHLFQTVKFVTSQDEEFIPREKKLDYLRTLRAQLSDHEQVMLYYNAIVDFGKEWIDNKYFTDYRMIHNLPLPLADFGIRPEIKFEAELKADPTLFEWLE
jgi:hypothetical protein